LEEQFVIVANGESPKGMLLGIRSFEQVRRDGIGGEP